VILADYDGQYEIFFICSRQEKNLRQNTKVKKKTNKALYFTSKYYNEEYYEYLLGHIGV
jgi:spermidine synthase